MKNTIALPAWLLKQTSGLQLFVVIQLASSTVNMHESPSVMNQCKSKFI